MITDVCVPLSQLPNLMEESSVLMHEAGLPCPVVAHAGDGNFHVFIMFDPKSADEQQRASRLAKAMARRAIAHGGTCTGEHGVGVGKRGLLLEEAGAGAVGLMRMIKDAFDPLDILCPGKVLLPKEDSAGVDPKDTR